MNLVKVFAFGVEEGNGTWVIFGILICDDVWSLFIGPCESVDTFLLDLWSVLESYYLTDGHKPLMVSSIKDNEQAIDLIRRSGHLGSRQIGFMDPKDLAYISSKLSEWRSAATQ